MKRSAIIPLITFLLANACTPIDKPEKYPDEEYSVEKYTPEIPTDENWYTGDSAGDKGEDTVVDGDASIEKINPSQIQLLSSILAPQHLLQQIVKSNRTLPEQM